MSQQSHHWQKALKQARFELTYSPDALILDVRTPEEYAEWHLRGATLVPTSFPPDYAMMYGFARRLLNVSRRRERPIIVYCRRGIRADAMIDVLRNVGFYNVINLGGVETMPLMELRRRGIDNLR